MQPIISQQTIKTYNSLLRKAWLPPETKPSIERLNALPLPSKKLASIAVIRRMKELNFPQEEINPFAQIAKHTRIEDNLLRTKRGSTQQEIDNFITWNNILSIRQNYQQLATKNIQNHMKYIILCLFTYLPPNRGEIFINCYVNKDIPNYNILDTNTNKFIIRKHKTKSSLGTYTIPIPPDLQEILKEWVKVTINHNDLLLFTKNDTPLDSPNFTQLMYRIFQRKVSTDMLRKIYITHKLNDKNNPLSIEDRINLANQMGHTITQQDFTYNRFDI